MAGILAIDRNWNVVFPWVYSVDTRSNKILDKIEGLLGGEIRKSSGGIPFMAAKIKWIEEEFPDKYRNIAKFINLNTYVAGKLCSLGAEDAFIDYSVLAMYGLADVEARRWNSSICNKLKIDMDRLPAMLPPFKVAGKIPSSRFQTENDIEVLVGVGDKVASFFGAGFLEKQKLIDETGTYTVLGFCTDRYITDSKDRIITSIYSGIEGIYFQFAVVAVGGYLYSWFTNKFRFDPKKDLKGDTDTEGLYFIPHFSGRAAPSQPYYRGVWFGIKWNHELSDFYVAMLESLGYEYDFIFNRIKKLNNLRDDFTDNIKVIGGGSKDKTWNLLKASILNLKYRIMKEIPYELFGAFLIAKNGNELPLKYKEFEDNRIISCTETILPDKSRVNYYKPQCRKYIETVNKIGEIYRNSGA
ncbi:MAG: hypothetical protein FJW61_09130, partial [Actinobacteria bacterium]|nr:hypothetical protein [Actinomycetota bacterium]